MKRPLLHREAWSWRTGSHGSALLIQTALSEVDFRHELEYGVTDKFQVSIYLADWFYESNRGAVRFYIFRFGDRVDLQPDQSG